MPNVPTAFETDHDGHAAHIATVDPVYPDEGAAEAMDDAEVNRIRAEAIVGFLQLLISDGENYRDVGRRALMIGHILHPDGTQRELARRMGIKESLCSQKLKFWRHVLFNGDNGILPFGEKKILSDPHL